MMPYVLILFASYVWEVSFFHYLGNLFSWAHGSTHSSPVLWTCDWDLLYHLIFIAFLVITFLVAVSVQLNISLFSCFLPYFWPFQSEVFAVAFAMLAAGAIILTLNVLLLVSSTHFDSSIFLIVCSLQPPIGMKLLSRHEVMGSHALHGPQLYNQWESQDRELSYFIFAAEIFHGWIVLGRAHNLLPESESSRLLPISSGCWSLNLHAERQRHHQDNCGVDHVGVELMGSIPIHECCCSTEKKSPRSLSSFPDVYFCWISYHCHRLRHWGLVPGSKALLSFTFQDHIWYEYIVDSSHVLFPTC